MAKVSYCVVGSNRLDEAKAFYDALLGSIGMATAFDHPSGGRAYSGPNMGLFGVLGAFDGKPATIGNGSMAGFSFDTKEEVDAFHGKAIQLGGADEGAPGERAPGYYFSYFRDLEGNKLCGYHIANPALPIESVEDASAPLGTAYGSEGADVIDAEHGSPTKAPDASGGAYVIP